MRWPRAGFGPRLNWQLVVPVVSWALLAVGVGLAVCAVVAAIAAEGGLLGFVVPAAVVIPLSVLGLLSGQRLASMPLRARDGFFAVALAWVAAALVGAAPFLISGTYDRALDAFFESMSGFTTTGATLVPDVESLPASIALWRSMTEFLGGVGIVVLVVAVAPATGLATQRVFYAETSGMAAERLTPRISETAKIIGGLYAALTVIGTVAYLAAGMGAFDAVNHAMTTLATGGFSTRDGSIDGFGSVPIQIVAIVLMVAAGINFAFYWRAIRGRGLWPQAAEVRLYLAIFVALAAALCASLLVTDEPGSTGTAILDGTFVAASMLSGTGFVTADFDHWNDFARALVLLAMFVGGCAGSTTGGLKVIRVLLLGKIVGQELRRQLQPRAVLVLRTRGRVYSEEVRRGVLGFTAVYMTVMVVATLAMLLTGLDLLSAASSSAATLNIVGTAMGELGASDNYAAVSDAGRVILCVLMLAGRLEVFTILVLLTPAFWRPNVA